MGRISPIVHEYIRVEYVEFDGTVRRTPDYDITGPIVEQERLLAWVRRMIEKDGGKVVGAFLGTKRNGEFIPAQPRRKLPMTAHDGFRRASAFIRG